MGEPTQTLSVSQKRDYIDTDTDNQAAEIYLLSELETIAIHSHLLWHKLRRVMNTANSRGLDVKWGNHLQLIAQHFSTDLTYLESEIKRLQE